jgi:hypothetical protein
MTTETIDWPHFQDLPLSARREVLTSGLDASDVACAVTEIMSKVTDGRIQELTPLRDLQNILEGIRTLPPGIGRIRGMNTFVRTLGRPDNLATLIDVLRASLNKGDKFEASLSERSRRGRMHCIYGWAGQTLMLVSPPGPTTGTEAPVQDMEFIGYPPAEWDMSIHIWQPNLGAEGFLSTKRVEPDVIVEPPHSHPFSFVSYVSKGLMHQSIYAPEGQESVDGDKSGSGSRYAGVILQEVDGVWPPHEQYVPRRLRTLEDRVLMREGDSYFLPTDAIHDVEIDLHTAADTPTITLFLCAEATVKPKAYLAQEMADFHRLNPELKEVAVALKPWQWDEKLRLVASYLRGESSVLRLDEAIQCNSTYGFMHL